MELSKEERQAITKALNEELKNLHLAVRWDARNFPPAALAELEKHRIFLKQLIKKVMKW